MTTHAQRLELAALMDWCLAHKDRIHYPPGDVRTERVSGIHTIQAVKDRVLSETGWTVDCSQFCYALLGAVGLKPPHQDGYTGTMLADLPHYTDPRHAETGALVVYGPGTGHHVAMVRHADTHHGNPVVCSQGSEPDPRMVSLLSEAAGQPHPFTMLSIAKLG